MAVKVIVNDIGNDIKLAILNMDAPVARACSAAVFQAGLATKYLGRTDITQALGARLANAWSVRFYPGGSNKEQAPPPSIDAAAFVYHKIPFISIFQYGGTINGDPLLWIPLKTTPLNIPGIKGHATPKKLIAKGIKLFGIKGKRLPLLAAKLPAFDAKSTRKRRLTLSRVRKALKAKPEGGALSTIPLFFGLRSVTIKKKLHLIEIAQQQLDNLPTYYLANLKLDNSN